MSGSESPIIPATADGLHVGIFCSNSRPESQAFQERLLIMSEGDVIHEFAGKFSTLPGFSYRDPSGVFPIYANSWDESNIGQYFVKGKQYQIVIDTYDDENARIDSIYSAPFFWAEEITRAVVRGMDNRIYYQALSGLGWEGWLVLPGSTIDRPAAAMLGNQLHSVVRGSDGNSLWHGYLTNPSDPASFSSWSLLSGATSSAPTLTSNGTVLCLVVRGLDDRVYYRCYNGSWGSWYVVPTGATPDAPAAAMLGNDLHIVVRGMDQSSLWDTIVRCDGTVVRDWRPVSGATNSRSVLASSQGSNKLYLAVRGMDNRIYYRSYTNSTDSWGSWSVLPTGATNARADGNTLWCADVDLGTSSFTGWVLLDGATPSAPTLAGLDLLN